MSAPAPGSAAEVLLATLASLGIAHFWDDEDGMVVVHPADVSQLEALNGTHVVLSTPDGTGVPADGYTGGCSATVYVPDGGVDFAALAEVYEPQSGSVLAEDVERGAKAAARWLATPRSAGAVLLAALAERGIGAHMDERGGDLAVPLTVGTPASSGVRNGRHLTVADRHVSIEHEAGLHTGWTVFVHGEDGMAVGDPVYIAGDGCSPVDCAFDSATVSAFIAGYLTASVS